MKVGHALMALGLGLGLCAVMAWADPNSCRERYEQLRPLALRMPWMEFDQSDKGWRSLQDCGVEAALLIDQYAARVEDVTRRLRWHQAQLLAMAGHADAAIRSALASRNPPEIEGNSAFRWNPYADATIAFLRKDRKEIEVQRDLLRLAVVEHPENRNNLAVLDRLADCFDKSYKQAYVCETNSP
ncbi:MAG: hypothetical protein JO006_00780 [Paucibacter sp.]|nr:hypothetical protein [Roseateles sp.]